MTSCRRLRASSLEDPDNNISPCIVSKAFAWARVTHVRFISSLYRFHPDLSSSSSIVCYFRLNVLLNGIALSSNPCLPCFCP